MKEEDVLKFLAAGTHLGDTNLDFHMEQFIYKKKSDGICVINLKRTCEKLLWAALTMLPLKTLRIFQCHALREYWPTSCAEVASAARAAPTAGRVTPGSFTKRIQAADLEPQPPVATDPRAGHQLLTETSYMNLPTLL